MATRWNGWGDAGVNYPLSNSALNYLEQMLGKQPRIEDIPIEDALNSIPDSNLPYHPNISTKGIDRLRHSRGQSLPDWIDLRYGTISKFTDGVIHPRNIYELKEIIKYAYKYDINMIPFGGGTSVLGHVNPVLNENPNLTIDTTLLFELTDIDETSQVAKIGAGIKGPALETLLNAHGYTLGHFPQSFEYSTLGGWIATKSCGQQSALYGRIETMVRGISIETPAGSLVIPTFPASAAGPDLAQLIIGSEGKAGIITQASMIIRPIPKHESFNGYFFRDLKSGVEAARNLAQRKLPISMLRLSDPVETEVTLQLSGKEKIIRWADRGLRLLNFGERRCLLIIGFTDQTQSSFKTTINRASSVIRNNHGMYSGKMIGRQWERNRFITPYLRNTLWEHGYAVDTFETSLTWSKLSTAINGIKKSINKAVESFNQRTLVLSHISHVYTDGASLYFTYIFPRTVDAIETLEHWKAMKKAASKKITALGGTISHQHGVGLDHLEYMPEEKGELGLNAISAAYNSFDPKQLMNPGKLY